MEIKKLCKNCHSPNVKLIPAGISRKNGKPYEAFYSCPDCNMTESIKPRSWPQKPQKQANFANNNDKFQQLTAQLDRIEGEVMVQGLQINAIEVLLKINKEI